MQVPTRKPGKFSGQKPDPHLTEAKYLELKNKLERLKKYSQPRAIAEVRRLAEMGDFSDNTAYQMAKGRLRGINQGLLDIADHLKRAIIIKPIKNNGIVVLGCTVTVEVNGKSKDYLILGSSETDPLRGVISHNSPIGSALLGKKIGEVARIKLKDKIVEYKVIAVK